MAGKMLPKGRRLEKKVTPSSLDFGKLTIEAPSADDTNVTPVPADFSKLDGGHSVSTATSASVTPLGTERPVADDESARARRLKARKQLKRASTMQLTTVHSSSPTEVRKRALSRAILARRPAAAAPLSARASVAGVRHGAAAFFQGRIPTPHMTPQRTAEMSPTTRMPMPDFNLAATLPLITGNSAATVSVPVAGSGTVATSAYSAAAFSTALKIRDQLKKQKKKYRRAKRQLRIYKDRIKAAADSDLDSDSDSDSEDFKMEEQLTVLKPMAGGSSVVEAEYLGKSTVRMTLKRGGFLDVRFAVGDVVLAGDYIGALRYLGPLAEGHSSAVHSLVTATDSHCGLYMGIECTQPVYSGHNGVVDGIVYFELSESAASNSAVLLPIEAYNKTLTVWEMLTVAHQQKSELQKRRRAKKRLKKRNSDLITDLKTFTEITESILSDLMTNCQLLEHYSVICSEAPVSVSSVGVSARDSGKGKEVLELTKMVKSLKQTVAEMQTQSIAKARSRKIALVDKLKDRRFPKRLMPKRVLQHSSTTMTMERVPRVKTEVQKPKKLATVKKETGKRPTYSKKEMEQYIAQYKAELQKPTEGLIGFPLLVKAHSVDVLSHPMSSSEALGDDTTEDSHSPSTLQLTLTSSLRLADRHSEKAPVTQTEKMCDASTDALTASKSAESGLESLKDASEIAVSPVSASSSESREAVSFEDTGDSADDPTMAGFHFLSHTEDPTSGGWLTRDVLYP